MEDIIEEAKILANKGIKELIIIAQDTTKYGVDLYGKSRLAELLGELSKIEEIEWIRFLYSYPEGITDELIETVRNNPKICKYFDIPIQHISNEVLKRMNRHTSREKIERFASLEKIALPEDTDYHAIKGLRLEAAQKLSQMKPESVGRASRISGVSPADCEVLLVYLEQRRRSNAE